MYGRVSVVSIANVLALACMNSHGRPEGEKTENTPSSQASGTPKAASPFAAPRGAIRGDPLTRAATLPCQAFTHAPAKPHDPSDLLFSFDQLEDWYRVPGEFTHRLDGDRYGFETLSFIISETHPGGGPGLHVHDTEEAHVLLEGRARYRIGEKTFTVQAPYVAKVPAGVPHTFINVGTEPFNLIAVFATKHPSTSRVGPNPLVPDWEREHGPMPCGSTAK